MPGNTVVINRSIRLVSGEVIISTTMKDGASWKLIDQIKIDGKAGIHANSRTHQIVIYPREE